MDSALLDTFGLIATRSKLGCVQMPNQSLAIQPAMSTMSFDLTFGISLRHRRQPDASMGSNQSADCGTIRKSQYAQGTARKTIKSPPGFILRTLFSLKSLLVGG